MVDEPRSVLAKRLNEFARTIRTARRNECSLATHPFYARKSRENLAALKRSLLALKRTYPAERFPGIASQIARMDQAVAKVVNAFPNKPNELLYLLDETIFLADSDLAAEIDATRSPGDGPHVRFIPEEIVADRSGVLKKVIWEANTSYNVECYNACAAMIRRAVESLIIEAFEHQGIADKIRENGEYVEFGALIGKATAESRLGLTRTAKRGLPDLKFLGDLGAHNRKALVRRDDLDRIRNQARLAVEELAHASQRADSVPVG